MDILKTGRIRIQNTGVLFKLDKGVNLSDIRIVVGNNTEADPIYDIKSIINYFAQVTPQVIEYSNVIKNPEYVPIKSMIPFGERNKVYLNIALLLFIVIAGIFGFFWMKKDITHYD